MVVVVGEEEEGKEEEKEEEEEGGEVEGVTALSMGSVAMLAMTNSCKISN